VPVEHSREQLTVQRENAVLVSVLLPDSPWLGDDPLAELRGLADTAGACVVAELVQKRQRIEPGTYLGKGKLEELVELVQAHDADVVIFDNDLSPAQTRNIEKATQVKALDRSELILDIFATQARSTEARLQVELAQLEYSLPRLRNLWKHLGRIRGGIGLRGPGETQLEEDRRLAEFRIRDLRRRIAEVEARRQRMVRARREEHTVSLVGYTNAGKSTLMNALTGADVYVADKLFSTLDTRTRQWHVKDWGRVLLSDTVGFIRSLPHHLIASFKATLEEARQARLLLHVVDASNPQAEEQIAAVNRVLKELACDTKPTLLVWNKADAIADLTRLEVLARNHPHSVAVSARTGQGLAALTAKVVESLGQDHAEAEVEIDAGNGRVLAFLSAHAQINEQEYLDGRVRIRCRLPKDLLYHVEGPGVSVKVQ